MSKVGWFNEHYRHSLAARGIKTNKYYAQKQLTSYYKDLNPARRIVQDGPIKKIKTEMPPVTDLEGNK